MESLASGGWLTRARVARIGWIGLAVSALMLLLLLAGASGTLDGRGRPLGTDFSGVWTAGRMALDGHAAQAWDWPQHRAAQEALHGRGVPFFGWHYPPPLLLVAAMLATMPYLLALLVWQAATFAAAQSVVSRIVPDRHTRLLCLAAPVTLICVTHGHNGFLTGSLLGGGLLLLERRPLLAGMLLGCLLYKPQFALLIGPFLLLGRNWRALLGAAASAGALIGVTLLLWGWPVWQAFLDSLPLTRSVVIEAGATGFHKIMSPFAAARLWGAPVELGYVLQAVVTVLTAALVFWTALRRRPFARNAALCAATVICTPYVMDYDHVVVGIGIAFFVADAREHGWRPYEKTALAMIWFAPMIARTAALYAGLPLGLASALLLLLLAARRCGAAFQSIAMPPLTCSVCPVTYPASRLAR